MARVVRLGDTGSHGGSVITSAAKWRFDGALCARRGDLYACPLHGINAIAEGSPRYLCEGQPIARHGDLTECGASLISGASKDWSF